jgi:2-polyprenyl-6-methoxyphenol hydroxylase-like FAD-dependent oxidoreductase
MDPASNIDVLISGAGAAGLTLAIDLARRGVSVRIIEKRSEPFAGSRGKGIKPRTQEVFEDLGVIDRVVAAGGVYPPDRDYQDDGSFKDSLVTDSGEVTSEEPYLIPLMVPQFLTEAILRERLLELGARVEFGHELTNFQQDSSGVTAQVNHASGGTQIRAQYLIGADGGRSFVRQALDIEFPGKTLGVRAVVADVIVDGVSDDVWHRWADGDMRRQIFLCPLRGTSMFQIQGPVPMEGEVDLSARGLTALLADRTHRTDIIVKEVRWVSDFQMNARLADRYRVGRVFLCGDSAHVHPPTGGQGLNTSIQDSYNLGWKLAAALQGAPASLLESYEEERRPIAADMLGYTTKLLDALKERGELRRGREGQQLDLGYAGSTIGFNNHQRDPALLAAGDRAPDAPMKGAAGQVVRAFELYKGHHWTLLGFKTDSADSPAPRRNLHIHRIGKFGDLRDSNEAFQTAYRVEPGDWVLIRPDGYIGAIVSSPQLEALDKYMRQFGLSN